MEQKSISFAGAGRVAGVLCRAFLQVNHKIDLIVSRTERRGAPLADSSGALWSAELIFPDTTDVIIVSVPDHELENVLHKIKCNSDTLVAHTAGSLGLDVFPDHIKRKGVFYPLQTFTDGRNILTEDLPFLLESSEEQSAEVLKSLAESLGGKVYFVDIEHRRLLHLAAVFTSNFTNHLLTIGKEITYKAGFPLEILNPLMQETISKAMYLGPEFSQTGPAIRNDQNTIGKHLELLSFDRELQQIYTEMTRSIIKYNLKG